MVALVYANVSWLLFELINNDAVAILIIRSNSFASFHSVFLLYSPNAIKHCFTLWMRCSTLQSLLPVQCTVYMYSTRTFSQFVNMYIQAIIFTLATVVWEYVCIYSPVIRCLSVFIFIKCNKFMKKKTQTHVKKWTQRTQIQYRNIWLLYKYCRSTESESHYDGFIIGL